MDSYDIQRFLHIAAALVGLGAAFALPLVQAVGERRGAGGARVALEIADRLEKFLIIPGAVVVLLVGVGLIFDDATGYKDDFPAWLAISIIWFLVAVVGAIVFRDRAARKALDLLEGMPDDADLPADYRPLGSQMQMVVGLLLLSIAGIALLMVWRP